MLDVPGAFYGHRTPRDRRLQLVAAGDERPGAEAASWTGSASTSCRSRAATRTTRPGTKATPCRTRPRRPASACPGRCSASPARTTRRRRRSRRPAASAIPRRGPSGSSASSGACDRTEALGLSDIMLHAGLSPRAGRPGPQAVPRHAGEGRRAGDGGGHHGRLRDRPGDGGPAPPHARRPEVPEPEGQLRPRQHAALRHGRPDPRRRDPRPRHPQRPRQGREPHEGPGHVGRGGAARPGPGEHQAVRQDAEEGRLPRRRCASSARSAIRSSASATSPTASAICANAWRRREWTGNV